MRRVIPAILALFILLSPATAHRVQLIDGSQLEGQVLLLTEEHLILSTDFAGTLRVPREKIAAVYFTEPAPGHSPSAAVEAAPTAEGTGRLELVIQGEKARSSVRYQRESEREGMLALNTLYLRVYSGGRLVYEESDGEMEKDHVRGKWTVIRNSKLFGPADFELPAGTHRLQIVIGNDAGGSGVGVDQELVSAEVLIEDLIVLKGETTHVVLKGKSGRLGSYGKYELELLSSR